MTDAQSFDGGCACGSVRYRMTSTPLFVHCCHCRWCQRESGAAFALNALIEADRVEKLSGEVVAMDTPSNSGKGQIIVRCRDCRVTLWSHYAGAGKRMSFVRVGTLDDPDRFPPDLHIFTESKQPWVEIPEGHEQVERFYRFGEAWPEDSRARWKVLLGQE